MTERIDVVLGPTESSVLTAAERRIGRTEVRTTVVAPLASNDSPRTGTSWSFGMNASVERRAEAISDYLSTYRVRRIVVLFDNSTASWRAQRAFRASLVHSQGSSYEALPFEPSEGTKTQIDRILRERPEAVGSSPAWGMSLR